MNIRNQKINTQSSQQGLALVIGLIMLLIMTLIGVQSMRSTTLGEQMTRNTLDRERALEAAELALLIGEDEVANFATQIVNAVFADPVAVLDNANFQNDNPGDGCLARLNGSAVTGLCIPAKQRLDYGDSGNDSFFHDNWIDVANDNKSINVWTSGNFRTVPANDAARLGVITPPKYIIEFMGFIPDENGTRCNDGFGTTTTPNWPFCPADQRLFRITALATGGVKDNARVMLQSNYVVP